MVTPEQKRLDTVRQYALLNYDNNSQLKDLVILASEICQTPVAMITLMDEDSQWIKIKTGTELDQNSRENSFCKHLINTDEVLVVPDAAADYRFAENSIVKDLGMRFYAGAPLITTTGYHLGSLCVFHNEPKDFTEKQENMLLILSRQAMHLMELEISTNIIAKHHLEILKEKEKSEISERKLRAFFNSSTSGHILLNEDFVIIDFNKASSVFTQDLQRQELLIGTNMLAYIAPSYLQSFISSFKQALAGQTNSKEILLNHCDGQSVWWNLSYEPVFNDNGTITSVAYSAKNIDEHKQQLAEIKAKNQSLLNIAYIQSHEYRRPVASIMGLMGLIKDENYLPQKDCLLMMEEAVKELDEKIKVVVKHTNSQDVAYPQNTQ